jgi:TetR/AcrR family transcriptional regulator, repressor for uid operon
VKLFANRASVPFFNKFFRDWKGMPKLAPQTQHARRERILDAAERCFISKGFHPATMDDICRAARVSPGAVYTYFASKEELIVGLCEREKERFSKELAQMTESENFMDALRSMAEKYCCHEPIEKVRLHVEIGAEAGRNAVIGHRMREIDRAVSRSLEQLLENERDQGRIAPKVPIEIAVRAMGALGDGLFLRRSLDPDFDPKSIIPAMMTMIEALLAPSPRLNETTGPRP